MAADETSGQISMEPAIPTASFPRHPIKTLTIAHAFGGIDGKAYLNCKECFEHHYQLGYRYFEADLWMASDGYIVFFHNGLEKRFGLPVDFTSQEFMARRLEGRYSPLDAMAVARLMRDKPDWYLITDVKTDNEQALRAFCKILAQENVDYRERVIPEFYDFQEIEMVKRLQFTRSILALYRLRYARKGITGKLLRLTGRHHGITEEDVLQFVAHYPEIAAVSMPIRYWNSTFNDRLKQLHVQTFVHTINSANQAQAYFKNHAGIFTDRLPNRPY